MSAPKERSAGRAVRAAMTGLLAIHTATDLCEIAFGTADGVRTLRADGPRSHSERLVPLILEITVHDMSVIRGIALAAGPGSFTGLRIGLSTAKGILFGQGLPLYAVSTLAALAQAANGATGDVIVPVMRARRDELYAGVYQVGKGGIHRLVNDAVVTDDSLGDWIARHAETDRSVLVSGPDAVHITRRATLDLHATDVPHGARSLLELSGERPDQYIVDDISSFEPYYCKDFVAKRPRQSIFDRLPF